MHLRMAVLATAVHQEPGVGTAGVQVVAGVALTRVAAGRVALLAEQRWPLGQRRRVIAAVGAMAQAARFSDRCVFPQVGPAFLGVTGVAGVIDVIRGQQKVIVAIMNVVTITAGHASEAQRMPGRLVGVRAGPRMTTEAGLLLLNRVEHRIAIGMERMARGAGHINTFVAAAEPSGAGMAFVAIQASPVLL